MVMSPEEIEDNRHSDPPEQDVECPLCLGTATRARYDFSQHDGYLVPCPRCEGSGTVSADEVDA